MQEKDKKKDEILLLEKNTIRISKTVNEEYHMECEIENKNLILEKIIDFDMMKLVYDLNADIYEKTELHKISDLEADIFFIMKDLFPDLGIPQRFAYLKVKKQVEKDPLTQKTSKIVFQSQFILDENGEFKRPEHVAQNIFPLPIERMDIECIFFNEHKMYFSNKIKINQKKMKIPAFLEKMTSHIIYKVFLRLKQFIENYTL
jgi:hypothetical protein